MSTDLLHDGLAWLSAQLKAGASQQVVYRRGAESVTVNAVVGKSLLKLDDGYGGVRITWTDRDFLIAAEDLVIGGNATLPQRGDRIEQTIGDVTHIFEVAAPGGEPEWRWSDPHQIMLRIHTVKLEEGSGP